MATLLGADHRSMAAMRRCNDHDAMPDFLMLAVVVVAFVGTVIAVLWGIAAGTGGSGEKPPG